MTQNTISGSEGSSPLRNAQLRLAAATRCTLATVVADVRAGLAETVGVKVRSAEGVRSSVIVELPTLTNEFTPEYLAHAIDMENVEAWCDEQGHVHVAIGPWYSTKDVDQVVLSITKVAHVLLGLHATDARLTDDNLFKGFWRRLLAAWIEVAALRKRIDRR